VEEEACWPTEIVNSYLFASSGRIAWTLTEAWLFCVRSNAIGEGPFAWFMIAVLYV
jgi:hypothetical protein